MPVMGYLGYYYYDATYLLVILGAVLSMIASARVNGTFSQYSRVRSMSGMTGAQAARRILDKNGLYDVKVEHIRGNLTDHYDPRTKVPQAKLKKNFYFARGWDENGMVKPKTAKYYGLNALDDIGQRPAPEAANVKGR